MARRKRSTSKVARKSNARNKARTAYSAEPVPGDILDAVRRHALRCALPHTDYDSAEDLASKIMESAWLMRENDPAFLTTRGELEAWVSTAVKNALIDHVRGDDRRTVREESFGHGREEQQRLWMCPHDELELSELAAAFQRAMERAPAGHRLAYMAVHEKQLSYKEAAVELNTTVGTVAHGSRGCGCSCRWSWRGT